MKLDELARIVDYSLDDYKHLRSQIENQKALIEAQEIELERLRSENAQWKEWCLSQGLTPPSFG